VVVISAHDDTAARARAIGVGATAFYGKPFSPMALLNELEKIGRTLPASRRGT
jgi:CheY-like chemotaxis protein